MAEKKKQHYVPQNYLRGFSDDMNIGVFQIDGEVFYRQKGIKKLAQKSYFYTKITDLEDRLSEAENTFARNRKTIKENPYQELTLDQKDLLYQDMFLQMVRVPELANLYNEIVKDYVHGIWRQSKDENVRKNAEKFDAKIENAIILAMMSILPQCGICSNLKAKLLINKTGHSFITSDNPVVLNNSLMEYNGNYSYGLNSSGLQIFYPLFPQLGVIYYDEKVYKVGLNKQNVIDIKNESDVYMLNCWIMVNATNNIYFDKSISESYIRYIYAYAKKHRQIQKREETKIEIDSKQSLVIARYIHPHFSFRQTYIKLLDKYKKI